MFVLNENKCIYYEMAKLNNKKRENYSFTKKKSLVGLTSGVESTKFLSFDEIFWQILDVKQTRYFSFIKETNWINLPKFV